MTLVTLFSKGFLFDAPPQKNKNEGAHDFSGQDLAGKDFSGKNIPDYDFSGANLINACFANADLKNTIFDRAGIRKADFIGARNLHSHQLGNILLNKRTKLPENLVGKNKIYER